MSRGHLFLILGPSGSGKGTVIVHLRRVFQAAVFPISCTTRAPRPGEKSGEVYYFVDKSEFQRRIQAGDFLEWAIVHNDNYYGTLKSPILDAIAGGKKVIREVDIQGVESIRALVPRDQVTSIFITTPSWENLRSRILKRSQISADELAKREASFRKEIAYSKKCDFIVRSEEGKIAEVCGEVEGIIRNV